MMDLQKAEKSILKKSLEYCYPVPYRTTFGAICCAARESGGEGAL